MLQIKKGIFGEKILPEKLKFELKNYVKNIIILINIF